MFYFEGSNCSRCGTVLKENDDVVACPICGSPHHRACYTENGGCANESMHNDGFSWKREDATAESSTDEEAGSKAIFCGICGAENSPGRMYCHNCGKPLFEDAANEEAANSPYNAYNRQFYNFADTDMIEDVTFGDVRTFLGPAGVMFAPLFYQMHKLGKKVSFNLIALLFPAFWFLNRKMYGRSLLIILFNLLSNCFTLLFYGVYSQLYKAAVNVDSELTMTVFNTYPVICGIFTAFAIGTYAISIISALYCNHAYKKWTLRKIRRIRKKSKSTEEYKASLEAGGQTSFGTTFLILLIYFALILLAERFVPAII